MAISTAIQFLVVRFASKAFLTPLVHEVGHVALAALFFNHARPTIRFNGWFQGATTAYAVSYGLTRVGSFLGRERAITCIAAGGALASVLWAAFVWKQSRYLALAQLFDEAMYALSALQATADWQHDYVRLWEEWHIHPLIGLVPVLFATYKMFNAKADSSTNENHRS